MPWLSSSRSASRTGHPADAEVAGDLGFHQPVAGQEKAAGGGGDDGLGRLFHHGAGLDGREPPGFCQAWRSQCGDHTVRRISPRPVVPNSHV